MKKEFIGFYEPSEKEIEYAWSEGFFVFDANALLNLYRYSEATRNDFLLALQKLKDRLYMPYQVGYEFHSNRHNVIESLKTAYSSITAFWEENFEKQLKPHLKQFQKHPAVEIEKIFNLQEKFIKDITAELEKQEERHPNFSKNDTILIELSSLYENKLGKDFSNDQFIKIYQEGKDRYEQLIPPGYKDSETKKKKGDRHIYGDFIIWKDILDFAKKQNATIILITDDRKEDWWTIEHGKTIRPRNELIKEFFDITGHRILIYNADQFLHHAKNSKLVSRIKETSISEIKEVRENDEAINTVSEFLEFKDAKDLFANTFSKLTEIGRKHGTRSFNFPPPNTAKIIASLNFINSSFTPDVIKNILNLTEIYRTSNEAYQNMLFNNFLLRGEQNNNRIEENIDDDSASEQNSSKESS